MKTLMSKENTPIAVGTRVYTDSQNRGDGIVYAVYNVNEKLPAVQRYYVSDKTYDIVFYDGTKALDLEERTLRSHCWTIVDGIAPIDEIEVLLAKSASATFQHHEQLVTEEKDDSPSFDI